LQLAERPRSGCDFSIGRGTAQIGLVEKLALGHCAGGFLRLFQSCEADIPSLAAVGAKMAAAGGHKLVAREHAGSRVGPALARLPVFDPARGGTLINPTISPSTLSSDDFWQ